MEEMKVRKLQY